MDQYVATGKIRFAFRHYPLPIHSLAQKAAEAAECAGRQGKFWEFHDRLFQSPRSLADSDLHTNANTLSLNTAQFGSCLSEQAAAVKVKEDFDGGRALGITGTPTFFFGMVQSDGRVRAAHRLNGAQSLVSFQSVLDKLVSGTTRTSN
jgi:protein-disulfide isomerase